MSKITLFEGASPGTPSTGQGEVYFSSSDKKLHVIDDAGVDTVLGGGGDTFTPFVVDAGGATAYSVVQTAIDDAHSAFTSSGGRYQVVLVRPGDYTEDLTFKPGVTVMGTAEYSEGLTDPTALAGDDAPRTVIIGQHTITQALGVVTGSARNIRFKSPATAGTNVMFAYGTGSSSPGKGLFTWANCLFDQEGNTFDERIIHVNSSSATDDRLHFAECTFWLKTVTSTSPSFVFVTSGTLYVSFKSCQLVANSGHNAFVVFERGELDIVDCRLHEVRVDLGSTGFASLSILGSRVETGYTDEVVNSGSISNSVFIDETSIQLNNSAYAFTDPMQLRMGAVSFSKYTVSAYNPKNLQFSANSPLLRRGSVAGTTVAYTTGGFSVPVDAAFVDCDTTGGVITLVPVDPEHMQGFTLRVFSGPNAATPGNEVNVTQWPGGSVDTINVNNQIVTYQSVFFTGKWMWLRVAEL